MTQRQGPAARPPAPARNTNRVRDQRGMVTAELALGSLVVACLCLVAAWAVGLVSVYVGCQDLASQVARQRSRGDQAAVDSAISHGPAGSHVAIAVGGGQVTVTVTMQVPPIIAVLPPVPLSVEAHGRLEPGVS